jgi:4-hydroxy-3-polyprenylbenzoate decarboxylase
MKKSFNSLSDFLHYLSQNNQLIRVSEPVSTILEITEIHKRLIEKNGPAILFENVVMANDKPSKIPVVINLFGTKERIAMGLGIKIDQLQTLGETLAFFKHPEAPENFKDILKLLPIAKKILAMKNKFVKTAPCQEIVLKGKDINLFDLPIQTCWPNEPAPLITWPLVITKGKKGHNVGIYRMQLLAKDKLIMRWLKHRGGAEHHREHKDQFKEPLPVAAVIGSDPATILTSVMPLPENISELKFSGLIRAKPIELVKCKTIDLEVPANAEIVIEGLVSLDKYAMEGPYGDHTGYYNEKELFPEFQVTAITMRKNPVYMTTYTGKPPDEPSVLGEALNEVFTPIIKKQFPEIVDFYLPPEGCSYRIAVVSIKKSFPGHAKRVMMGIWSYLKQFIYTKIIIVVDEKINCRDWKEVMWAVSTKFDPSRDVTIIDHTPIDYLDFASPESELGGKIGIDATDKIPPETSRTWGIPIKMTEDIVKLVDSKWKKYKID